MGLFGWGRKKNGKIERRRPEPEREEKGGAQVCFVLCPQQTAVTDAVTRAIQAEFGSDVTVSSEKEDMWFVEIAGSRHAFLAYMGVPVPDEEAESNIDGNLFWENGRNELEGYGAHIIAGLMSSSGDAVETNITLTRMARAALQAFNGFGVYWGSGAITHSKQVFLDMSEEMDREDFPLFLWTRFQPLVNDDGKVEFYTRGLGQFGLMEIEVTPCSWKPSEIMEFVYNTSCYLINSGPVINDGDTVGGTADQKIKVRHAIGEYDDGNLVYKIHIS